ALRGDADTSRRYRRRREPVDDLLPTPCRDDDVGHSEDAEVVAARGLRTAECVAYLADVHVAARQEQQEPKPRRVREKLRRVGGGRELSYRTVSLLVGCQSGTSSNPSP